MTILLDVPNTTRGIDPGEVVREDVGNAGGMHCVRWEREFHQPQRDFPSNDRNVWASGPHLDQEGERCDVVTAYLEVDARISPP